MFPVLRAAIHDANLRTILECVEILNESRPSMHPKTLAIKLTAFIPASHLVKKNKTKKYLKIILNK